ncbi:DegT/DnrJ/EryC1/StrS family aminotransferase [Prevotella copri]|uniref:GDP-perosamine synthase n=1 Tax=Segatella copri TaxID=165179 RepID=A0AAW5IUV4_9BACT|nr:DegT/DnrJ/EryC1/StrS family aminotransferase [Segatella copri]MCP9552811.1 DegT/DnrJ/EryC1/StrS family aminotransferase [Segatella copri]MCP9574321.1 DegT/DnrJ/EryC1/StrS family aminotransferase [Segatella copri]MCP9576657.1 DegT/DnrJ/EryC1/StrS family aminotransferase [Segatella copri]MCP9579441.1 DegT/DnrJ/EryC1/StrS family aminotransferase [Segatella copri]MCP9583300.1 DegT/DnrJ/EryC1/StrS family aminotransferase [Segatella copri]
MAFIPVCEPMLAGNELKYVTEAVSTGWISSSGKYVTEFEKQFAEYCGCKYGIAVCNGTIALHLALIGLGIGKGDEVIVPTFTMIASAFAVCYTGAKPVFVDADKDTWNIDVKKIEEKITSKTKAIMPVHIFGKMCDMDAIHALAKKYNLYVLEDAAEAHGASYHGVKAGASSDIAAFSFFANKNITTGEGGMVVTNNKEFYDRARYFKNVCFPLDGPRNYQHEDIGYNYRMSNVVAAIGLAQVEKADDYKGMRIRNHQLYKKYLSGVPGILFQSEPYKDCVDVCWMNTIVINSKEYGHTKDELIAYLKENEIDTRLLFTGMHKQKALQDFGCDCSGDYPVCEWLTENGFYLPSASSLTEDQIKKICDVIISFKK